MEGMFLKPEEDWIKQFVSNQNIVNIFSFNIVLNSHEPQREAFYHINIFQYIYCQSEPETNNKQTCF